MDDACTSLLVDGKALATALGRFSCETVTLVCNGEYSERDEAMRVCASADAETGSLEIELPVLDSGAFPERPDIELACVASYYDASEMRRVCTSALKASSTDITRYNLNAVYLESIAGESFYTATDGHRLAQVRVPQSFEPIDGKQHPEEPSRNAPMGLIIPRLAMDALGKALGKRGKLPTVEARYIEHGSRRIVSFRYGAVTVSTRCIGGIFPDYRFVIPKDERPLILVDSACLVGALQALENPKKDGGAVKVTFASESIALESDQGSTTLASHVSASLVGKAIGINPRYLRQAVEDWSADKVRIEMDEAQTENCALLVLPDGCDDAGSLAVVMPIRI